VCVSYRGKYPSGKVGGTPDWFSAAMAAVNDDDKSAGRVARLILAMLKVITASTLMLVKLHGDHGSPELRSFLTSTRTMSKILVIAEHLHVKLIRPINTLFPPFVQSEREAKSKDGCPPETNRGSGVLSTRQLAKCVQSAGAKRGNQPIHW